MLGLKIYYCYAHTKKERERDATTFPTSHCVGNNNLIGKQQYSVYVFDFLIF